MSNKKDLEDFVKEAIFLNKLNHPNIIRIHGICFHESDLNKPKFTALEYMNQSDLLKFVRSRSRKVFF